VLWGSHIRIRPPYIRSTVQVARDTTVGARAQCITVSFPDYPGDTGTRRILHGLWVGSGSPSLFTRH